MESIDNEKNASFFMSPGFNLALKITIASIIALMIFQLGMFVGFKKASFAFGWGDNYHRVFGGPEGGILRDFAGKDFMNGHGAAGSIAAIEGSSIIIKSREGVEKDIVVTDATKISAGRSAIMAGDLKHGDTITVIGRPQSDGTIKAEIIRLFGQAFDMPSPPPVIHQQFLFK